MQSSSVVPGSNVVLASILMAFMLAVNAATTADQYSNYSDNINDKHIGVYDLKAVVSGQVYCDICRNGKIKKPLQGVRVGVFCWDGTKELEFYDESNERGRFRIELNDFDYARQGGKACGAKLISASYNTSCTQATNLHNGLKGANLHIKSKSPSLVSLLAGPFAYTSPKSYPKECSHNGNLTRSRLLPPRSSNHVSNFQSPSPPPHF